MKTHASTTRPAVFGSLVDDQTRCIHYHSSLDIIAIRFKCCDEYFPCFTCHEEAAGHAPARWPKSEWEKEAILCGSCGGELSINQYMTSKNACPLCQASFNPGCGKHYHLYFETD